MQCTVWFSKNELKNQTTELMNPKAFIFSKRITWSDFTNALEKSLYNIHLSFTIVDIVELLLRNPC